MTDHDHESGVEPIAIVGLAARVPGAGDTDRFWRNLVDGVESVTFYTREEQLALGVTEAELDDPSWVSAAPVVDQLEYFDADLFGMTAREAELANPQHRLFLEASHTALEDAGYDPARYPGSIGVYAGTGADHYQWTNLFRNPALWNAAAGNLSVSSANYPDYVATLTSYKLDLRGPSLTVHTACSTSLVAIHLAVEALRNVECDMALAGGVCVELPHGRGYQGMEGYTSPDGHCRPFDARANGTLWGSGVGVVLLKRLSDAIADGDQVRGVIIGNAVNNDGANKVGFSAPSVEGQAEAVAQALSVAGIDPRSITYVEAHGTGTALGDPIEVSALSTVYTQGVPDRQWCAIGSVKSNLGHLSQAAGVVGLVKTVLSMEHGLIPPTINFEEPNPALDLEDSPFRIATTLAKWEATSAPRRAAVSSFGIGGTNAHVIVEEAPPRSPGPAGAHRPAHLLRLSARSRPAL
ncbi:MAG TPA: polyketide synthase, partial [Pseudonocardiaceae bacterium]